MPLFILGVRVAEPSAAFRAMHGGRIIARLIVGRHSLAQALQVFAREAILYASMTVIDRVRLRTVSAFGGSIAYDNNFLDKYLKVM